MKDIYYGKIVSRNHKAKYRIVSLDDLVIMTSVYHKGWDKMVPVAFLTSMQLVQVQRMIEWGYLYSTDKIQTNKKSFTEIICKRPQKS